VRHVAHGARGLVGEHLGRAAHARVGEVLAEGGVVLLHHALDLPAGGVDRPGDIVQLELGLTQTGLDLGHDLREEALALGEGAGAVLHMLWHHH
jgi:hypothetical protein